MLTLALAATTFAVAYEAVAWTGLHAMHLSPWAAYALPAVFDLGLAIAAVGAAHARQHRQGARAIAISYAMMAILATASIVCQVTHVTSFESDGDLQRIGVFLSSALPVVLLLSVEMVVAAPGRGETKKKAKSQTYRAARASSTARQTPTAPPRTTPSRESANPVVPAAPARPFRPSADRDARLARPGYRDALEALIAGELGVSQNSIGREFSTSKTTVGQDKDFVLAELVDA